jgi:hypothetical protein
MPPCPVARVHTGESVTVGSGFPETHPQREHDFMNVVHRSWWEVV